MKTPLALALVLSVGACAANDSETAGRSFASEHGQVEVSTVASGLEHPWGLAFLPDGRMLVTERPGRLRIVDAEGKLSEPLSGLPEVWARGQGGLLDVAIDPDFASTPWVYFSFSEPGDGGAGTSVGRGKLAGNALEDVEIDYRPNVLTAWLSSEPR